MRTKIAVPDVDRKAGKAVLVWEDIECTFMRKITGGVRMVSKVYLHKDRLYGDQEVRIPPKIWRRMNAQAAAILKDKKQQGLKGLSRELRRAQVRTQKSEQVVLF